MVKSRAFEVLFATTLLALAGCSKEESAPEPAYGESTAPGPGASASAGDESATSVEYGATKEQQANEAASAKAAQVAEAERETQAFSDGQIVRIMETVDARGIEQAEIVQQTSIDPDVTKFAAQMVRHHMQSKQKVEQIAEHTYITQQPSLLADELARQWETRVQMLKDADVDRIDILYIDGQVSEHTTMYGLLEAQLIPSAKSDQLLTYLADEREAAKDHMEDAKAIQHRLTH